MPILRSYVLCKLSLMYYTGRYVHQFMEMLLFQTYLPHTCKFEDIIIPLLLSLLLLILPLPLLTSYLFSPLLFSFSLSLFQITTIPPRTSITISSPPLPAITVPFDYYLSPPISYLKFFSIRLTLFPSLYNSTLLTTILFLHSIVTSISKLMSSSNVLTASLACTPRNGVVAIAVGRMYIE